MIYVQSTQWVVSQTCEFVTSRSGASIDTMSSAEFQVGIEESLIS